MARQASEFGFAEDKLPTDGVAAFLNIGSELFNLSIIEVQRHPFNRQHTARCLQSLNQSFDVVSFSTTTRNSALQVLACRQGNAIRYASISQHLTQNVDT